MSRVVDGAECRTGTTAPVLPVAVTSAVAWFFPAAFLLIGLRFSLPDGRTVETQSSWGTNPPAAKPGAQVTVLYDLSDPTSASLPAGGTSAVVSGVIIALGGILIAVGLAAAAFLAVVL